jgi:hypothetical protein
MNGQGNWTALPKSVLWFSMYLSNNASNTLFYSLPFQGALTSGTETTLDLTFDYPMTITRARAFCSLNTKNAATTLSFRDDGADVTGTAITINAGATGEFDSGALTSAVAAGSKIVFRTDASTSTTGNISYQYVVYALVPLQ